MQNCNKEFYDGMDYFMGEGSLESTNNVSGLVPENKDFNIQQILNITGRTALNVERMNNQLGIIASAVTNLTDDMDVVKNDIFQLKQNEEITTTQQESIIETAKKRIAEIIGDDPLDRQKYFRIFIQRLYSDTRKNAGLGSKIARTRKGDFQRCIDYIEAWNPSCGCSELKTRADVNALARKIAKSDGYL